MTYFTWPDAPLTSLSSCCLCSLVSKVDFIWVNCSNCDENKHNDKQEYWLRVCVSPTSTLYLVQHFLSFSFQLRLHLKVFFCKRDNKQVIKKLNIVPSFMYLNTRCRNGTYLPFPLYLWSALLYRWWPVWVVANWQIIPIRRLHFQKGLTAASGWSSWSTICERSEKMSGSWHWTSIL